MSLVDPDTGEVVVLCSKAEAERLTAMIRSAAEDLWSLLLEAHDRRAWAALGYSSWREYATAEFGMSQSRAYQLLDAARVVGAIEQVTSSTKVEIPERAARDIKPRLKAVTGAIRDAITAEAAPPPPERIKDIVAEVVEEERAKVAQRAEDRQAMRDLNELGEKAGMDLDKARLAERGTWSANCREIAKALPPADFIARHGQWLTDRHIAQAEAAYEWLDGFLIELREAR